MKRNGKKSREEDSNRRRRGSEGEDEEEEGSTSVSSWMADHTRDCHNGVMSADPLDDYEFYSTGSFSKPLHRQVDENLRITRAENTGQVKD